MTPSERVARIEKEATGRDLSSWERHTFLPSIKRRHSLTPRQEEVLAEIEERLFEGEEE